MPPLLAAEPVDVAPGDALELDVAFELGATPDAPCLYELRARVLRAHEEGEELPPRQVL